MAAGAPPAAAEAAGECGICYEAYRAAGAGRAPQQLPCRHSLCLACLRKLVCRAAAIAFVSCPFCRMVTLVPEVALGAEAGGPGDALALGLLRGACPRPGGEEEEEEGRGRALARSSAAEATRVPVFAVSGLVSPCGLRRGPEAQGAFVLGLPGQGLLGRGLLVDAQPPLASMENLRLGFAAGILVLIVSTFFLLVFLK